MLDVWFGSNKAVFRNLQKEKSESKQTNQTPLKFEWPQRRPNQEALMDDLTRCITWSAPEGAFARTVVQ